MGSSTKIEFYAPAQSRVTIEVFDVTGRLVRRLIDDIYDAGRHDVRWDGRTDAGRDAPNGLYFYRMAAGDFVESRKLVVLR